MAVGLTLPCHCHAVTMAGPRLAGVVMVGILESPWIGSAALQGRALCGLWVGHAHPGDWAGTMVTVADMQRAEAMVTARWEGVEAMPVDSFETGARETDDILGVGTAAAADLRWAGAMSAADL